MTCMAMTGCSTSDDDEALTVSNYPEDNVIRVSGAVASPLLTRGDGTATSAYTDDFALYVSPSGTYNKFTYNNVYYTYADGVWEATDGTERHWQSATTDYVYYAYAPVRGTNAYPFYCWYSSNYEAYQYETYYSDYDMEYDDMYMHETGNNYFGYDLSKENVDLLWAHGSGKPGAFLVDKMLNLTFEHQFCQFSVEVIIGNALYGGTYDAAQCPITSVSFVNATGKGYFAIKSGEFNNQSSCLITTTDGVHRVGSSTTDGTFTTTPVYFAPGEQAVTVYLTIGDDEYAYTHSTATYQAGKSYTLRLKVGESSINGERINISEWNDGGSSALATF
jgi:hypothetical protein